MTKFGGYLFFFAIASAFMALADRQFILMMWIDYLGATTAWLARGVMMSVGALLILRDQKTPDGTLRPPGSQMT